MSAIPIAARRAVPARTVVAALSTLAAAAIGLSVSPLGFVGLLTTEFGWADPHRPSLYAVPALVAGLLAGAWLGSRRRGEGAAWWVVAAGALATAAITAGQRLADGNTMWMSNWPGLARPWVMVSAGAVMGATAGALLCAARRAATPAPIAVAFAVGLVVRGGSSWFQARYDVVAALVAVAAAIASTGRAMARPEVSAGAIADPPAVATPQPSANRHRRAPWLALAVAALGYAAFTVLREVLGHTIASTGSNTADWAGAERAFLLVAAVIAGVLPVLAAGARRFGLGAARHVLTAAAVAVGLNVSPGADGWLPRPRVLAVVAVAVVAAWLMPATWRRWSLLPVVQAAGLVLIGLGVRLLLSAPIGGGGRGSAEYTIAAGAAVAAVAAIRDVVAGPGRDAANPGRDASGGPGRNTAGPGRNTADPGRNTADPGRDAGGAGDERVGAAHVGARLAALALLVLMAGEAAMSIYGSVIYRIPPGEPDAPPPLPATYLPLCWTLLLLPVGLAVAATLGGIRFGRPATGMAD